MKAVAVKAVAMVVVVMAVAPGAVIDGGGDDGGGDGGRGREDDDSGGVYGERRKGFRKMVVFIEKWSI